MSGQVRRSVVHPTSLPFEAPVIARILLIILAELTLTVSARLRYLGNAGPTDEGTPMDRRTLLLGLLGALAAPPTIIAAASSVQAAPLPEPLPPTSEPLP